MLSIPKEVSTFSYFALQTGSKLGNPSRTKPRSHPSKESFPRYDCTTYLSWCYSLFNLPPLSNNNDHNNFAKDLLPTHFYPLKGMVCVFSLGVI